MKILITAKPRWGRYDLVIQNSKARAPFAVISGKKTINMQEIAALKALGHKIEYTEFAQDYLNGKLENGSLELMSSTISKN